MNNITNISKIELKTLADEILRQKKMIFDLRLKKATKQEIKPHLFRKYRRSLARLLTTKKTI